MKYTKETSVVESSPTDVVIEAHRNSIDTCTTSPEADSHTEQLSAPHDAYCELLPNDVVLPDTSSANNHVGNLFYRSAVHQTAVRLQLLCKDSEGVLANYQTASERLLTILQNDRKARILQRCKNSQYIEHATDKAISLILDDMLRIRNHDLPLGIKEQPMLAGKKINNKEDDFTAASTSSSPDTTSMKEERNRDHAQLQQRTHDHSDLSPLSPRQQYALQLIQKLTNAWHRQQNAAQQQQHQSLSLLINTVWADELISVEETVEQSRIRWQLRQRYVAQAAGSGLQEITRRFLERWKLPENCIAGLASPPASHRWQQQHHQHKSGPHTAARLPVNYSKPRYSPSRPAAKPVAHKKATRSSPKRNNKNRRRQQQQVLAKMASTNNSSSRHHRTGPLSAQEKAQLYEGIRQHGICNWSIISEQCVPTRSRKQLGSFGQRLKDMNPEQLRAFLLGTTTTLQDE